jgi:TPR repeat protein
VRASFWGAFLAALVSGACSRTYHPEYHPETRYSFVQNISVGEGSERCKLGRAAECWRECFHASRGEACYLLGLMFETGHGVARSHADAERMSSLARSLGYAPASIDVEMAAPYIDLWRRGGDRTPRGPQTQPSATVSSPGGVVVYGSVNGDVYVGK